MTLKKKFKNTITLLIPLIVVCSALVVAGPFAKHGGKAALVIAGAQMPEEGVSVLFDELEGSSPEEIQKQIDALELPTAKSSPGSSGVETLADNSTPQDISQLIKEAELQQANAKRDGDIKELTYGKANASVIYGNVSVRNVTNSHGIDIKKCLASKAKLNVKDKSNPVVLIYHTHTTEGYEMLDRGWYSNSFPTRSSNPSTNMVRVGDAICERLSAAGYGVIHDTEIHDTSYSGSYARSRESIERYKKEYPSLQVIIDVHRDGIKNSAGVKTKPVAVIDGKKAAQIMIIAGCQDGKVKDFTGWEDNLNFAVQLQNHAESLYPGLMRPIYFSPRKYNMDTSSCGVLLEIGSDANTLGEAVYSGALIGDALASLLNAYD